MTDSYHGVIDVARAQTWSAASGLESLMREARKFRDAMDIGKTHRPYSDIQLRKVNLREQTFNN
jgi:hypothetical protein